MIIRLISHFRVLLLLRCEWESLLRYLILSTEIKPSRILVELCMDQLIRVFGRDGKMDEIRDWAVDEMDQLLFEVLRICVLYQ